MTKFDYNELTIIGITLALAQRHYDKNSSEWRKLEHLLEKIKKDQQKNLH